MTLRSEIEAHRMELAVRSTQVRFFAYNGLPDADNRAKIDALAATFQRMPDLHLARLYPILLIQRHPTPPRGDPDGGGGGTSTNRTGGFRALLRNADTTGLPADHVEEIAAENAEAHRARGVCFIPINRWRRDAPAHTVFHEVGHCIDYELVLSRPRTSRHTASATPERWSDPRAEQAVFPGIDESECGGLYPIQRRAAIAYAHLIVSQLGSIASRADARTIVESFRRTPAFRSVPDAWWLSAVAGTYLPPGFARGVRGRSAE